MGYYGDMKQVSKKKALRRLQIIQGQVKGLAEMVRNEKYCVDIITQSSAIKEALVGVDSIILENHLSTHVLEQIKRGKEKKAITEILKVYKLTQKRK